MKKDVNALQAELETARGTILYLEQYVGRQAGQIAQLQATNQSLVNYIRTLKEIQEKDKEKEEGKKKNQKKGE